MSTSVFAAHGHSGRGTSKQAAYALCMMENCYMVGNHSHNGTTYTGHYTEDVHDYHQVCSVTSCDLTESHEHDGMTCLPHNNSNDHGYHNAGNRTHH